MSRKKETQVHLGGADHSDGEQSRKSRNKTRISNKDGLRKLSEKGRTASLCVYLIRLIDRSVRIPYVPCLIGGLLILGLPKPGPFPVASCRDVSVRLTLTRPANEYARSLACRLNVASRSAAAVSQTTLKSIRLLLRSLGPLPCLRGSFQRR